MANYTKDDDKIKRLVAKLKKWDESYFNSGKPLVPDERYDKVRLFVQKRVPDHPYLQKVGIKPKTGKKVKLPYYMPSLDKIYPDRGAEAFLKSSSGDFSVLYKLDGVSALAINVKGTIKLYTRGNGSVGQDITPLLKYVKGVGKLKVGEAVRGELMIKIGTFESKLSDSFENARNTVSGVANSNKIDAKVAKHIDFVVHELVHPATNWNTARVKLKSAGFLTAPTEQMAKPTIAKLTAHLNKHKTKIYDIDGIVLIDNKTGARISFKVNSPNVKATVDRVDWQLSKHGIYKPVAIFKTAIKLSGVSVKRATAHNAKTVVDLGIGPGAIVLVTRAGDVIPKIEGVHKKASKVVLPENFKWNNTKVDAVATNLSDSDKDHIKAKRMTEAFRILAFDGIRGATARILVDNGYNLIKVLKGTEKEFLNLGVGNANSAKLYEGITKAKTKLSHGKLMWATHIWPSGFTDTKFDQILAAVPYSKLIGTEPKKLIQTISNLRGFSATTAASFVKHLPKYEQFVDKLGLKINDQSFAQESNKLKGMSFVFTKFRDKTLEEDIKKNGGKVSGSISEKTTAVIVKSKLDTSTKIQKAKDLGVDVLPVNEFKSKYGL